MIADGTRQRVQDHGPSPPIRFSPAVFPGSSAHWRAARRGQSNSEPTRIFGVIKRLTRWSLGHHSSFPDPLWPIFAHFRECWQEWRDSNPRPSVLETDALPTELHSCGQAGLYRAAALMASADRNTARRIADLIANCRRGLPQGILRQAENRARTGRCTPRARSSIPSS